MDGGTSWKSSIKILIAIWECIANPVIHDLGGMAMGVAFAETCQ